MHVYLLILSFLLSSCADIQQRLRISMAKTPYPSSSLVVEPVINGYPKDSQRLAHVVLSKLLIHPSLKHTNIQCASYFGNVIIVGQVGCLKDLELIKTTLKNEPLIKKLMLYVKIKPLRNKQQLVVDSVLKTRIVSLLSDLPIASSHLQLICNYQRVYVLGSLDEDSRASIRQVLSNHTEVQSVHFFGS